MKITDSQKVVPPTEGASGKAIASAFAQIMNLLINVLAKLGLLKEDLDYHVVRASMVIIYFFFGYQKWFAYEAQELIPFISNGPFISWMYPVFGIQGASWFFGGFGMVIWRALVLGILEQKARNSGSPRFMCYIHNDHHYYSIYAGWLGRFCRRLSGDDRTCRLFDERRRSLLRISLFAEAGCNESVESCQAKSRI